MHPQIQPVRDYFIALQDRIVEALQDLDGTCSLTQTDLPGPDGALARPRVLSDGAHIEKAAVQFTHSKGQALPPAATQRNPLLEGRGFQAASISLIVHPRNPYVPTTHANLRFFLVDADEPFWYFGGGFDLTPYYGFAEDARHWHEHAKIATGRHYRALKTACDEYFYLPHREECRGIGGIFFDDWRQGGFPRSLAFAKNVGDQILPAYRPIVERRMDIPWSDRQRDWQLYRRGRYAEFNLAIDRGTKYGLQSGRRIESVLASLPPQATWKYDYHPESGSPEALLYSDFLPPRDWV